jgi:hypothetical protein
MFLVGCATALKKVEDLPPPPTDFEQKIETATTPAETTEPVAPPPPVTAQKKAKKKKLAPKAPAPEVFSYEPKLWPFGVGEKITLVLRYGVIEGGIATLEVDEPKLIDGQTMIHYIGRVKSSKMLEFFYKVDDTMESWVTADHHLTRRMEIRQLESNLWGRRIVLWDQAKNIAKYYSTQTNAKNETREIRREDSITPFAQDVFSALYFYRFIQDPRTITFPIHDRWKNWNNELTYMGEETITVPAGTFLTDRFKMLPRVEGQLQPQGDVEIWTMKDQSRVLVQFKAKIRVGAITGELKEYIPGQAPTWPLPRLKTPLSSQP